MEDSRLAQVKEIHQKLRDITRAWAAKREANLEEAAKLRSRAIRLNHKRYFDLIPMYKKLALDMKAPEDADKEFIAGAMVSTDDIFKSYNPEYLDNSDFEGMTKWLETIYFNPIDIKTGDVHQISSWIGRLGENGVFNAVSSGTTGRLSFVPRDQYNWDSFINNSASYVRFILADLEMNMTDFDSVSLSFKGGHTAIGLVGQRVSKLAINTYYLFDAEPSPDALRILRKGPSNEDEKRVLEDNYRLILSKTDENYERITKNIFQSTGEGQRSVKIYGAPYQLKQLCERMISSGNALKLLPKSTVSYGGGWKTFEGEKIERAKLIELIKEAFGVEDKYIFEGYSMSEMNVSLMRCVEGRYHIPPLIEPIIYDNALLPMKGNTLTGCFGYLDPFATSYPGFIVSGDEVDLVVEKCPCGRIGPAIVGEVRRAPSLEAKGCGGARRGEKRGDDLAIGLPGA